MRPTQQLLTSCVVLALVLQARGNDTSPTSVAPQAQQDSWRTMAGDDPAWADPAFDDSTWTTATAPQTWKLTEHAQRDGYVWYRCNVPVSVPLDGTPADLGVLIGPIRHGSYEAFVAGRRAGSYG